MNKNSGNTALITGATSGIGKATAVALAAKGFNLILTGRRADRLTGIATDLYFEYGVATLPLVFDVRDRQATADAIASIPIEFRQIDVLVNNAGLASGLSSIQTGDIDDWEQMIDTNIKGLLYVTKAVVPTMIERGGGHIVNVSSIAGREVYENGNVYCATKHAVSALSQAMRLDLLETGIKVSNVCPGAVETEFSVVRFHGDTQRAKKIYEGYLPLNPEDIAEIIVFIVTLSEHICVSDVLITPKAQASASRFFKKQE